MQYRIDPKSGNELSALGFGCMRFPRDAAKTEKLILSAIEGGVNYFDTAYIYLGSEVTLGEILHRNSARGRIRLATKLPHQKCREYKDFDELFAIQLERLKTDYIDYYLIHNISGAAVWSRLRGLGIERWIAEKKANGQIRRIGFSFHGAQDGFFSLLDIYDWDFCQIQYNYMNENYQAGRAGLLRAREKGLAVIIMEPLLGGKLATGLPPKAAGYFRNADPSLTAAAWALRWLWNQPEVTVVLSGMNSAEQLSENLKTAEAAAVGALSEKESAVFAQVAAVLREAYKIPCTGCNYCMPCPHGVNIPGCFAAYNTRFALGIVSGYMQYITGTGANHPDRSSGGRRCKQCGACVKKCPQNIDIIKSLDIATRRMEPFWFTAAMKLVTRLIG